MINENLFQTITLVTPEYLQGFRQQLLKDIEEIVKNNKPVEKEWLRIDEVKKLYKLSTGTLLTLRNNGTIPYSKIGGIIYYKKKDIDMVLEENIVNKSK